MENDPVKIIQNGRMGWFQIISVFICVVLNALDGFDVAAISFASNGIAAQYDLSAGAFLGTILAAELVGMAIGSVLLGRLADGIGRRPTMIICLLIMAIGMGAIYFTTSTVQIIVIRVLTGLGIGGMLACANAMVAECSNSRNKPTSIMIMAAGYPLGIIFGGLALRWLGINGGDQNEWRHIFVFGGIVAAVMLPFVVLLLPESVAFLMRKRPQGVVIKINRTLGRMGHPSISELPPPKSEGRSEGFSALFRDGMGIQTVLLTIAYFAHILVFYFILKWIPKLVAMMNAADPDLNAIPPDVLIWVSVGGATGSILLGLLTRKFNLWILLFVMLVGSILSVIYFGQPHSSISSLSIAAAVAGFFTNSVIVAFYALFAIVYPPKSRAGGTGFVIGIGRGGAALAPVLGGVLIGTGLSLSIVATLIASGSVIALLALIALMRNLKRSDTPEL